MTLAFLLTASGVQGAQLSWTLPDRRQDGTPLAPSDAARVIVQVYWSRSKEGPWEPVASSLPGATTVTVPDPPPASSRWYTAKAALEGAESGFAAPVRRTNYAVPVPRLVRDLAKKAMERRKAALLAAAALVLGLGWAIRLRNKRRRR